jgi:proteasome assembly chaperone (PAC2) family protein
MDITKFKIKEVHISTIKHGDTIIHADGLLTTVGRKNITRGFCGIALFGYSYNSGTILVKKVLI